MTAPRRVIAAACLSLPFAVLAHTPSGAVPHVHDGDLWSLALVAVLAAAAAWLDRRSR